MKKDLEFGHHRTHAQDVRDEARPGLVFPCQKSAVARHPGPRILYNVQTCVLIDIPKGHRIPSFRGTGPEGWDDEFSATKERRHSLNVPIGLEVDFDKTKFDAWVAAVGEKKNAKNKSEALKTLMELKAKFPELWELV